MNETGATGINSSQGANGGCVPSEFGLFVERISAFAIPLTYGTICLLGIIGNSLVLVVVWKGTSNAPSVVPASTVAGNGAGARRNRPPGRRTFNRATKRNTTDVFMGNLAIADFMVCALVIPPTIIDRAFKTSWLFGLAYCKLQKYLAQVCVYISIYTLVLMSVDRFLAVVHPFASRGVRSAKNASLLILALWVTVCIFATPILVISKVQPLGPNEDAPLACSMDFFQYTDKGYTIYKNVFLFLGYLLPLVAISLLYWKLISTLWAKRPPGCSVATPHCNPGSSRGAQSEESLRGKKRVAKMVLVVVSLFAVCLLPTAVSFYLQDTKYWDLCHAGVFVFGSVAHVLMYANSCCNPFVYCFSSDRFRLSLLQTLPFNLITLQNGEDPTVATAGAVQMTSLKKEKEAFANGNDVMKQDANEHADEGVNEKNAQAVSPC